MLLAYNLRIPIGAIITRQTFVYSMPAGELPEMLSLQGCLHPGAAKYNPTTRQTMRAAGCQ
jgi:hypothetical protein